MKRRKPASRPYLRETLAGFEHEMKPFFVGLAAAEFIPADPAQWVELSLDAGLRFGPSDADSCRYDPRAGEPDRREFLLGWMAGTPGGREAIAAYVSRHGIDSSNAAPEG